MKRLRLGFLLLLSCLVGCVVTYAPTTMTMINLTPTSPAEPVIKVTVNVSTPQTAASAVVPTNHPPYKPTAVIPSGKCPPLQLPQIAPVPHISTEDLDKNDAAHNLLATQNILIIQLVRMARHDELIQKTWLDAVGDYNKKCR